MNTLYSRFLICALAVFLLCAGNGYAQSFQAVVGDANTQRGHSIKQLADGYVIAGYTSHTGTLHDIFLIRMGAGGNVLWAYCYDIGGNDRAYSVDIAADGGFVVTGETQNTSHCCLRNDIVLLKTDNNGAFQWAKVYGGSGVEWGDYVQRTADNGYIIAGTSNSFGAGDYDGCLIKTNANGDLTWWYTYGDTAKEYFRSAHQSADGGYIAAGYSQSYGNDWQAFVVRTNGAGTTQWARQYGGMNTEEIWGVRQTADGGFVTVGSSNSFTMSYDLLMVKLTGVGGAGWAWRYGFPSLDVGYSVKETAGNGLIVGGLVAGAGFPFDNAYLLKTNQFGAKQWSKIYGGVSNEHARDVITAPNGYAFAGYTASFGAGGDDVYVVKTDANGNTPCNTTTATEVSNNWTLIPVAITPKVSRVNIECTVAAVRYEITGSSILCSTTSTVAICCCQCADTTYCVECTNPNTFVCPCDTIVDPPTTTCTCVCNGTTYTYPCTDPETFVCPCDTIVDPPDTTYCTCVCGDSIWTYPCPDPMAAFCPCDTVGGPPSDTTEDWPPPGPTNGGLPGSRYNEGSVNRAGLPSLQPGEQFRVYPNPVEPGESFALVYALDRAGGITVTVTDMLGRAVDRTVHRLAGRGAIEVRTSGWPKGMYIITVQSAGGVKMLSVMVR